MRDGRPDCSACSFYGRMKRGFHYCGGEGDGSSTAKKEERAFSFIRMNERPGKPRKRGITEIRGPYYTPMGKRYLEDVLETMGSYVDALKFAGAPSA